MKQVILPGLFILLLNACAPSSDKADNEDGQVVELAQTVDYTAAEKTALVAAMPAPYNAADLTDGEKQFGKCRACHTITADKMNLTGPHLYGLFGRQAGSEPDYAYSDAMKAYAVAWDFATLDRFIEAPQAEVKGTKMAYLGIKDAEQRRNLIAYLKVQTAPRAKTTAASQP